MRFGFIEQHAGAFHTARLCKVMDVSSRGLRAFRNRPASRRQLSDLVTLVHIQEQSRLSLGSYGRPRMTEDLKEIGLDQWHRRVGRSPLTAASGGCRAVDGQERHIRCTKAQHNVTISSDHKFNIAANLLDRHFTANAPN